MTREPLDAEDALRREWLTSTPCTSCGRVLPLASLSILAGMGRTCPTCIEAAYTNAREASA